MPLPRMEMAINIMEIYEGIIDAVWPDYTTLLQCALTCRSWLPRSRYNLFSRPTLRSSAQLHLFFQALRYAPVLKGPCPANTVEKLTLVTASAGVWPTFMYSACALLAGRLPHLKALQIGCPYLWRDLAQYRSQLDLSPRMAVHIATFPTLKHLALNNVEITSFMALARVIVALPNISALGLCGVCWKRLGSMAHNFPFVRSGWLKLKDVTVVGRWDLMPGLSSIFSAADPRTMKALAVNSDASDSEDFATLLRYLPTYTSLSTLGVVDYSYPAGDVINGHTATELLNNLAPALRLDRFVVDFTYAQYDSRQNILESVAAVSKIMQDPPDSLCCLEIRVTDWDGTASWWKAEIVSLFFAAVRACGMLQVIVIRPHVEQTADGSIIYEDGAV